MLSIGLGLLELFVALNISKAFDRVGMLVFSKNLILVELQVCFFSVIGGFR